MLPESGVPYSMSSLTGTTADVVMIRTFQNDRVLEVGDKPAMTPLLETGDYSSWRAPNRTTIPLSS
jgi:hypothetical protein